MTNPTVPLHDFLAAALVPTNEQRIVDAVELIHADLERIETRLFAYINSITKAPPGTPAPLKGKK